MAISKDVSGGARTDLRVPFSEKDEAKKLGARWDPVNKVWFVPEGQDRRAFAKWITESSPEENMRAQRYFIAESTDSCWRCGETTAVYAFILPSGHEYADADDNQPGSFWVRADYPTLLSYVTFLPERIARRITAISPSYRLDYSKTAGCQYWMNHCKSCDSKLGDHELSHEPSGPFQPMEPRAAKQIVLRAMNEDFKGKSDSYSIGVDFLEVMHVIRA